MCKGFKQLVLSICLSVSFSVSFSVSPVKNFGENFIGAHWCPLKDTTPPTLQRKTNNHKTLKFTKVFSFASFCIALFVTALGIIQSNFFLHQIVNSVDDLTEEGLMKLWRGRKDAPRLQSDQSAASDESHDPKPTDQSNHTEEQPPQEQAPDQPEPPPESHDQIDPLEGFQDQPFVNAAALFRDGNYQDVIKLLTAAIDEGMGTLICSCLPTMHC